MVPLKKPVTQVPVTEASSITEGIVTYLSKSSGISIGVKSCHPFLTVNCGADNVPQTNANARDLIFLWKNPGRQWLRAAPCRMHETLCSERG